VTPSKNIQVSESPGNDSGEKRTYLLLQIRSFEGHGVGNDSERNKVLVRDEFACGECTQAGFKLAHVQIGKVKAYNCGGHQRNRMVGGSC
jgi:hypothetical protein